MTSVKKEDLALTENEDLALIENDHIEIYQLIYSPCIVSLVHILKITFLFLAVLNNLKKTNVIVGIVTIK